MLYINERIFKSRNTRWYIEPNIRATHKSAKACHRAFRRAEYTPPEQPINDDGEESDLHHFVPIDESVPHLGHHEINQVDKGGLSLLDVSMALDIVEKHPCAHNQQHDE